MVEKIQSAINCFQIDDGRIRFLYAGFQIIEPGIRDVSMDLSSGETHILTQSALDDLTGIRKSSELQYGQ